MTLDLAQFEHEYDLEALERIRPLGCDFEMLVTPRYLGHYVANRYEAFAAALMGAMSKSHRLFLDVGAHYGFFSLLAAAHNPEIEILALEPVPETHEVLVRNFALNRLTRAEALRRAASDRAGRTRFNVSLSSDNCGFYPHPVAPPIGEIEVVLVTVDQLLAGREPCPTLVKIDTDGHELPVLAGMAETLARFPDLKLLIELNPKMQRLAGHEPEELVAELGRLGFEVYLLDESARRAYRMGRPAAWRELMDHPESYVNLYCCRRETSLSVCFFSHCSALSGAERSLLELAAELVEDHGAICTVVLPEEGPLKQYLERAGAATLVAPYAWWCDTPYDSVGPEPRSTDFDERLVPSARELLGEPCRELRRIDPHVLVTNTLVVPWGAFLAPILGRPHVWHAGEIGDVDDVRDFLLPFAEAVEVLRRLRDAKPRAAPRWMLLLAAALADVEDENRRLTEEAEALAPEVRAVREAHGELARERQELGEAERRLAGYLEAAEEQFHALERRLAEAQRVLDTILDGATWSLALLLRKPLDLVAPVGSRRRQRLKDLVHWRRRRRDPALAGEEPRTPTR